MCIPGTIGAGVAKMGHLERCSKKVTQLLFFFCGSNDSHRRSQACLTLFCGAPAGRSSVIQKRIQQGASSGIMVCSSSTT